MECLRLDLEELSTLKVVLENDIVELRGEIIRTDKSEFREILKHKEQILKKILLILGTDKEG